MAYDYSYRKTRKTKSNFFLFPFIILIILIFTISKILISNNKDSRSELNSPLATNSNKPTIIVNKVNRAKSKDELLDRIKNIIADKPGSYSVYISSLKNNNETIGINENVIYTAASINKIPILASLYYLVNQGKINLDNTVTLQENDKQTGTGSIQYDTSGTVYSYKTLARLMMEKSDNTAAYILASQIIGLKNIQDIVNKYGLTQTDMNNNKTSNKDMKKLMALMYNGDITNSALTTEMLDFMEESDFENRIPAKLPQEVKVYHKIGNEIRNTHDVGIVEPPAGRPYYIGVLISDNPDENQAISIIADISKETFDYFNY